MSCLKHGTRRLSLLPAGAWNVGFCEGLKRAPVRVGQKDGSEDVCKQPKEMAAFSFRGKGAGGALLASHFLWPQQSTAPQWERAPLPFPILAEIGLEVIGMSGNIRIQIFPFFLIFLDIA